MFPKILFLIASFLAISSSTGQYLLFHNTLKKQAIYKVGDVMSFSTRDNESKLTSQILGFEGDSLIVFHNYKINPFDISVIYVDDKTRGWNPLRVIGKFLFRAGIGYPLLEYVNEGLLHSRRPDKQALIVGGILISASFVPRLFISDKIMMDRGRKLVIIDSE